MTFFPLIDQSGTVHIYEQRWNRRNLQNEQPITFQLINLFTDHVTALRTPRGAETEFILELVAE